MEKVRLGLLGTGFVQDFHCQAYKDIPNVELIAIGTSSSQKAQTFSQKWRIPNTYSGENAIEQICSSPDIDAVSICLPNDLHAIAVKIAAENGKHIICEKPLGRSRTEALEMLNAVESASVIHCYAENQVFFPLHTQALDAIHKGALGDVYMVRSREAHFGPHSDWFWNPERSGGGVALDMGCHSVEVARKAFKNDIPKEVLMWADTLVHQTAVEDNCTILVKYKHRQLGQAENSWSAHGGLDLRTEIYGSEGSMFMDNTRETGFKLFTAVGMNYAVEKGETDKGWLYPVPNEYMVYGYYHELKHFIDCIAKGELPIETFKDGVIVNSILDAAYQSVKEKRWIPVEL